MALGAALLALNARRRLGTIKPSATTMRLTAPDPTVQGASIVAAPSPSLLVLTAPSPSLAIPVIVLPSHGVVAITHPDPVVRLSSLVPDSAVIALTAPSPAISSPGGSTWANGFVAYRDIVIQPGAITTPSLTDLTMLFSEVLQGLRTVANGGRMVSSSGWDLRFESVSGVTATTGTKLAHELVDFDPVTGDGKAFLTVPSLTQAGRTFLRVYYGKALAATEEDAAALWAATRFVLDCATGADRSGHGFDLTMANGAAGEIIGPAGDFNGSTVGNRADASALAGLANFTLRCLIFPDPAMVGSDHGWLCVNTPTGSDSPAALMLSHVADSGGALDLIKAKIRTAVGNAYVHSTPSRQASARRLIHAVFQDGQIPNLYLDGVDVSGTDAAIQTGGMVLGTGGLYLGVGPRDPVTGGWQGLVDEMALIVGSHSPARVAAEAFSWNWPTRFYAIGGENVAGDANLAPIAPPMEITATAGAQTDDVDVAANGIDPGGGALTVIGAPTSDNGTVSVVANKLRGTPSTVGLGTWLYNLQEPGGKMCTGRVSVTVSPAVVVPTDLPKLQPAVAVGRWHCVGFTQAGSKADGYGSGRAGFAAAVAASNLVAGDVIVLADGTYSGAAINTLEKSGDDSADGSSHIMVRARNHGRAIIDLQLIVHGAYWWFTGILFTFNGVANPNYNSEGQAIQSFHSGFWVTNCKFTGYAFINIHANNAANNIRICYNTVAATTLTSGTDTGVFITMICQQNDRPPSDTEIAWNRVTLNNPGPQRNVMILHPSHSNGSNPAFVQRGFNFHHNHCVGPWLECMYLKRNIRVEFNYFEWLSVSGATTTHNMTFRHGLLTTSPAYDTGGIIRGNRFRSAREVTMILNGAGICVSCNVKEGGASGDMLVYSGNNIDGSSPPPPRDGCDNLQLTENTGFNSIVIGSIGGNLGSNTSLSGRNGRPDNVRIYKGDSGWNPSLSFGSGSSAGQVNILNGYGAGMAARVTPITSAALSEAGCDPIP